MAISLKGQFPPVNAIVATIIGTDDTEIFYPIFPSHIMMPLKVGEVVWVLYPENSFAPGDVSASDSMGINAERMTSDGAENDYSSSLNSHRGDVSDGALFSKAVVVKIYESHLATINPSAIPSDEDHRGGFWLSRVCGSRLSEDTNYTSYGRDFDERAFVVLEGRTASDVVADEAGYFPGTPNMSLNSSSTVDDVDMERRYFHGDNPEEFSALKEMNTEFTFEPTPRYAKKSGELILQGSNNTLVVLGEDSSVVDESLTNGVVRIVAGRGLHPDSSNKISSLPNDDERLESDKCPELSEIEPNALEGDLDFQYDFSTFLVSSNSSPDVFFCDPELTGASENITFSSTAGNVEGRDLKPIVEEDATKSLVPTAAEIFGPTIAMKSDHIRVIGRETIKFMVENPDGGPASAPEIIMHKDGNIFIKPGIDGQVYIGDGPDAGEPGTAVFADMMTFPDDIDGGTGFVAEMSVASKIPTRHSPKVKVKI